MSGVQATKEKAIVSGSFSVAADGNRVQHTVDDLLPSAASDEHKCSTRFSFLSCMPMPS